MMKKNKLTHIFISTIIALSGLSTDLSAQETGQVTFVTSGSVYVRFNSTENIQVGDTLRLIKNGSAQACLVVKNKSSVSCACTVVSGCEVNVKDEVSAANNPLSDTPGTDRRNDTDAPASKEKIRGRVSAASYSSMSSASGNTHRTMYRLSLDAQNINESKFSIQSYITYRQNFLPGDRVISQKKNLFNIYSMAVSYQVDSTLQISLGRKINRKVVSLGPVDGVQAEKHFGNMYAGAILGTRPDIFDNSFNANLLQYGAYFGGQTQSKILSTQTTVGLLEQKNSGATDRRYAYFQHSSTFNNNLSFFSTIELDLYSQVNGVSSSSARLTNLFLSARYRLNKKTSLSISYDTRKRILYYETFRNEIDRLLNDDDTRQTIRTRLNSRVLKNVTVGIGYIRRFQSDAFNKSSNINGYVSLSKIPNIGGRVSLNFATTSSAYLRSNILAIRHSRSFLKNKINTDFYFRMVNYKYLNRELASEQMYFGLNLSYRVTKTLVFSALGETALRTEENVQRVNLRLVKRFNKN